MSKTKEQRGLPPLKIGVLASADVAQALIQERVEEEMRRMVMLADEMGIPDGPFRWYSLALALAKEHVPELRESKPMGAPKKWTDFELGVLYVEMRRAKESGKPRLTNEQAAAKLAQVEPWKSYLQKKGGSYLGPDPVAALLKAFASANKNRFRKVAWDAYRYHVRTETVAEWEATVREIRTPT